MRGACRCARCSNCWWENSESEIRKAGCLHSARAQYVRAKAAPVGHKEGQRVHWPRKGKGSRRVVPRCLPCVCEQRSLASQQVGQQDSAQCLLVHIEYSGEHRLAVAERLVLRHA